MTNSVQCTPTAHSIRDSYNWNAELNGAKPHEDTTLVLRALVKRMCLELTDDCFTMHSDHERCACHSVISVNMVFVRVVFKQTRSSKNSAETAKQNNRLGLMSTWPSFFHRSPGLYSCPASWASQPMDCFLFFCSPFCFFVYLLTSF